MPNQYKVIVKNCYTQRAYLARSNFWYNPVDKTWTRTIDEENLEYAYKLLTLSWKIDPKNITMIKEA